MFTLYNLFACPNHAACFMDEIVACMLTWLKFRVLGIGFLPVPNSFNVQGLCCALQILLIILARRRKGIFRPSLIFSTSNICSYWYIKEGLAELCLFPAVLIERMLMPTSGACAALSFSVSFLSVSICHRLYLQGQSRKTGSAFVRQYWFFDPGNLSKPQSSRRRWNANQLRTYLHLVWNRCIQL